MVVDLQKDQDLEQLLERSKTNPVLIFKHSTQCSISLEVYREFTDFMESANGLSYGLVLVIENRKLSNAIAERFGIRHQSPQAILVKDGQAVWHASHWSINSDSLSDALRAHAQPSHQRN